MGTFQSLPSNSSIDEQSSFKHDIVGSLFEVLDISTDFRILPTMNRNTKCSSSRKTGDERGHSREQKRICLQCMTLCIPSQYHGSRTRQRAELVVLRWCHSPGSCMTEQEVLNSWNGILLRSGNRRTSQFW